MVLQAGALGITATDDATRRAAEELRAAGCQALDEVRDLVGILRTEPGGDQAPSISGLPELSWARSPVVGRTVYRIVREALTNARKHAPGSHVLVSACYGKSQVCLDITNGPAPLGVTSELAATGSGLGIAGLRRRIELVRGTLLTSRTADGGFRLEATLPSYVPTAEPAA